MQTHPQLLRTTDAAAYCGLSKSTLEKWRVFGGGPLFVRRGRSVFYTLGDLEGWMAALQRFHSTSEADAAKSVGAP